MCKCSELDWTNIDQTKDHHPDCGQTKGGVIVNPYPLEKDSVEFFIERVDSPTIPVIQREFPKIDSAASSETGHPCDYNRHLGDRRGVLYEGDTYTAETCKERFPLHTGFGAVEMLDESATLEECTDIEADLLKILAANSRFVVLAVIDEIERGTENGRVLRDLILSGR